MAVKSCIFFGVMRKCAAFAGLVLLSGGMFVPAALGAQAITVSGVVVRADRSTPIARATVQLSGVTPATTTPDGRFTIREVPPGRYSVTAQAIGYRVSTFAATVTADTTLEIALEPIPTSLDTVRVRAGTVSIEGRVRDASTETRLLRAQVTIHPGGRTIGAMSGSFTIRDAPRGDVTLVATALHHLPQQVTFFATNDTSLTIDLEIDSVALRMTDVQVARLATRAQAVPYAQQTIGREEVQRSGAMTVATLLQRRLPNSIRDRPPYKDRPCVFYDDSPVPFDVMVGVPMETVERIEIFGSRGEMIRVYSTPYVASLMRERMLPRILYMSNGLRPVCR